MANNDKENKIEKFTKEAIGKTLNQFNKEIGMADLVEVNKNQDRILNGILSQVNDENTEKTEKSNIITLDNSTDGIVELKEIQGDTNVNVSKIEEMPITHDIGDKEGNVFTLNEIPKGAISIGEIQGNTMANCNKDDKKELVLMKDLSTQGDNNITLTEGVDGGKVDVALEGNTLVNVSKTKEETPITHEREEDITGNHVALADEGHIRPVLNGKTMVNVCDQKDPTAVTKSYTVENSGNHVALQGDVDGSCRPVVTGNTLVNILQKREPIDLTKLINTGTISLVTPNKLNTEYTMILNLSNLNLDGQSDIGLAIRGYLLDETYYSTSLDSSRVKGNVIKLKWIETEKQFKNILIGISNSINPNNPTFTLENVMILEGDYTDKPIPDYFEGLQSSFEDNLVTQEMIDSGEEEEGNLGKYKVKYKATGKNKFDVYDLTSLASQSNNGMTASIENDKLYIEGTATGIYDFRPVAKTYNKALFDIINKAPVGTSFTLSNNLGGTNYWSVIRDGRTQYVTNTITKQQGDNEIHAFVRISQGTSISKREFNIQVEQGGTVTSYEPYKEYTKTLYLNSPLLEGDTIEEIDGKATHVHNRVLRSYNGSEDWTYNGMIGDNCKYICNDYRDLEVDALSTICDKMPTVDYTMVKTVPVVCQNTGTGKPQILSALSTVGEFKSWLSSNPIRIVGKLASPQYETISEDSIVCASYVSGHLDFNTAVPIERVEFKNTILENKYLYTNTEYTIQFEADKEGSAIINLGGTTLAETSIVKGLNKIAITTPETLTDNNLVLEGIGFNISDIVVTPTIEQYFGYFGGLSSVFESELVTDESDENYGKYKVNYKVTGKNKLNLPSAVTGWDGGEIAVTDSNVVTFTPNSASNQSMTYNTVFTDVNFKKGTQLTLSATKVSGAEYASGAYAVGLYLKDTNGNIITDIPNTNCPDFMPSSTVGTTRTTTMTLTQDVAQIGLYGIAWGVQGASGNTVFKLQLEYGDTATSYEPYKGHTKTLYLNSPLLEGDTIEEKDGGIYHVHRYRKSNLASVNWIKSDSYFYSNLNSNTSYVKENIVYCDKIPTVGYQSLDGMTSYGIALVGSFRVNLSNMNAQNNTLEEFRQWLIDNNPVVVYEMDSPTYELIEQSNLAIPSYSNGHLDFNTAVPVSKVNFLHFEEELTYLYPSTSYTVQFMSDKAISVDISLGGTQLLAQSIVKGLNRISITTPETLADNRLVIDGVGANISEVVVTDTNREFSYFEGMKSVGECEELEITSANSDNSESNTQRLTHEPLRAVGDTKDRYVLIDGKWYIERNVIYCDSTIDNFTISNETQSVWGGTTTTAFKFFNYGFKGGETEYNSSVAIISDSIFCISANEAPNFSKTESEYLCLHSNGYVIGAIKSDKITSTLVNYFKNNPLKFVTLRNTPVYEPLEYNPLEVYSGTTHITTNSTIPTNITVKNHGFNCILKPSTTYTISSNLGLNTVTTGADIGDSCLRFYNEDTSDITTMKNVLVLEGDWTTKADLIPANFSGIESAFEQEYDAEKGKYKVTAKVVGKNLFDKSKAPSSVNTGMINVRPNTTYYFYGKNTMPNGAYAWLSEYDLNGERIAIRTFWGYESFTTNQNTVKITLGSTVPIVDDVVIALTEVTEYEPYKESDIVFYIDEPLRGVGDAKDRIFIQDDKVVVERKCGGATFDGSDDETIINYTNGTKTHAFGIHNEIDNLQYLGSCLSNNFISYRNSLGVANTKDREDIVIGGSVAPFVIYINKNKLQTQDVVGFKQWLQQNPTTVVYQLAEPVYEEVEYSSNRLILDTFNNESFNNSTLFLDTNISPKLSFKPLYEELVYVKNSTKYYIQFNAVGSGEVVINLGGTELTTEIVEGYNCIPITTPSESTNSMTIIGQGITISEVIVSEVVCGGYYKGLQSCFEEHMENGKYRVLLRGMALDGSKVNGIKLYINEPLRGIGNIKDRLCIKNGKLMVEKNYSSVILDGTGDVNDVTSWGASSDKTIEFRLGYNQFENKKGDILCDNFISETSNLWLMDTEGIQSYTTNTVDIRINKTKLSTQDLAGFRQWLQQNPTTVVYQLSEPVYEEATNEYGLPIVFEGYENGIVYIDSAVTPTTHIKYTSNNQLATTLSEAEEQNITTQEDINMNVITYMMDIDMMLTDMEMSNDISVMAVRRDSSNENMLDRMSDEDKKVYRDNTVVMLEKMITAKVLDKEDIEGRIDMYYDKNRISKEQYRYLKSLL